MRYDDASQAGSMAADTAPVARADVDALPPGSFGPATGNAISGAGTITGTAGADSVGDAPARIVEVEGAGGAAALAGNNFQASGQYGVLNMDAQGNFNYVRNAGTPDGVQDVFRYTLADANGTTSSTTLTIDIGAVASAAAAAIPGVINLPPGVEMSDIRVSGRDLIITMPDGTQMVIPGGAVFVPQLVIGDVQVPASNLAALLIESEPQPAAGQLQSSGGNFAVDVPPLDPGVPLGDLIPPTELSFPEPVFEEVFDAIDDEPEIVIIPDGQPAAVNAVDMVDEAGLPTRGSEPEGSGEEAAAGADGDPSEATSGVISIDADDGIDSVTINGIEITTVGQEIDGEQGTLTITSINLATGQIGYSYLLTDNTNPGGNNISDLFEVTVTDDDGDTATATLTINIIDDEPTARDDTDSVTIDNPIAVGNVMTAVGTTNSPAGRDTTGADNAALTAVAGAGGSDSTFDLAGNLVVEGEFGTLTIDAEGNYTYVRDVENLEGGTDVFTYTLTDGDGDTDTATLTITVPATPNDIPEILRVEDTLVDEDGLPGANVDGVPLRPGETNSTESATDTGQILVDYKGDVPANLMAAITLVDSAALDTQLQTTDGDPITFALEGGQLIGRANGVGDPLVIISITGAVAGAGGQVTYTYQVQLLGPVEHAVDGVEDSIQLVGVDFQITDSNGDTASGDFDVTIVDDLPVAVPPEQPPQGPPIPVISAIVDEDDLPEGNDDVQPGDDLAIGSPTTVGGGPGSLAALFSVGADSPLQNFGLINDTSGLPALTANGHAVQYDIDVAAGTLTAVADIDGDGTVEADETIFVLTVNPDGSWSFELEGQLDHSVPGFEDNLSLDLSSIVTAEDADGDPVVAADGAFVVVVDDDLPTAVIPPRDPENPNDPPPPLVSGQVDEDDLESGNNDVAPGDDLPINSSTTASGAAGSLGALFNAGADQPLKFAIGSDTTGLPTLYSNNVLVTYNVTVDGVTGVSTLTATAGGNPVFTLTVDPDGSWSFELQGQLDHSEAGTEDNLLIDFSSVITAEDADGDPVTAADGAFVINVDDDMPQEFEECPDDVITVNDVGSTFTGDLNLPPVGADEPGTVSFGVADGDPVLDSEGNPISSNGLPLVYFINDEGVLEARAGDENGDVIFTITLNDDGTFTYDQLGPITSETELSITDLSSVGGGNVDAKAIDVPDSPFDLILTTQPGNTVNTNANEMGVGGGNSFQAGEILRIDLVQNAFVTGSGGGAVLNFGEYYTANSYRQDVSGLNNTQFASFTVKAIVVNEAPGSVPGDPADGDDTFFGDTNDTVVAVTTLNLYDDNGDLVDPADYGTLGITVTPVVGGGWQIEGLPNDYDFQIVSNTPFNAVQVEAIAGTDTFKLGFIDITSVVQSEVSLTVPIALTDADGDSVVCDIDIILGPPSNTPNVTVLVDESALNDVGSNPGSTAETVSGDLNDVVTGGTGPYTFALVGSGDGAHGTLTLLADGTYSYTLDTPVDSQPDADDGANIESAVESFTYQVTDSEGVVTTATISISIKDDVPTAVDDADSLALGSETASGNVMTGAVIGSVTDDANTTDGSADTVGADRPGRVSAVEFNGTTVVVPNGGFATIDGDNGQLKIYSNGDYVYTRADGSPGEASDTFTYTIVDADGDTDQADLVISIEDAPVTVNVPSDAGSTTVYETALGTVPEGRNEEATAGVNSDTREVVTGTITFNAADGLGTITIAGTPVNLAEPFVTQTVADDATGKLEITGVTYDEATGAGTISYRYTLEDNTLGNQAVNGGNTTASFDVDITDSDGDHSPDANLVITIVDDSPLANADTDTVSGSTAGGNVISGVGTAEGTANHDFKGADNAEVTNVVGFGGSTDGRTYGNVDTSMTVAGQWGSLNIAADGTYTYTRTGGTPGGGTETFTYTITDADGDPSTTTLKITLPNTPPTITVTDELPNDAADNQAFEKGLPARSGESEGSGEQLAGGANGDPSEAAAGSITFNSADGVQSITITPPGGGLPVTLTEAQLQALTGATTHTISGTGFTLEVGNYTYNPATGAGSLSYTFTLTDNTSGDDTSFAFGVQITDDDGQSGNDTLTVKIIDDVPTAVNDTPRTVAEDGADINGNVLTNDRQGADSAVVTHINFGSGFVAITSGVLQGDGSYQFTEAEGVYTIRADGAWTFNPSLNQANGVTDVDASFSYRITDGDTDVSEAVQPITVSDGAGPGAGGTVALTLAEAALDPNQDGSDLAPGTTTGSNPSSTGETQVVLQGAGLHFSAGSDAITSIAFSLGSPPIVSGLEPGFSISWAINGSGQLVGTLMEGATNLGTAIIVQLTGETGAAAGDTADVGVTATLVGRLEHANPPATQGPVSITGIQVVASQADGDSNTGTVSITVSDDTPSAVSAAPITSGLENGGGDSATASLDTGDNNVFNNFGADGGKVIFTAATIAALEGQELEHNQQPLSYVISEDGQTLTGFVDDNGTAGYQAGGDTDVFTIQLQPGGSSNYTVTMHEQIDSLTEIDFDAGAYAHSGGNDPWFGFFIAGNNDSQDLLITPVENGARSGTINLNANLFGVSQGNSVGNGEAVRIDFVTDLAGNAAGSGGYQTAANRDHTFDGHYTVNGASASIGSTPGSTVNVSAWNDAGGNNVVGDGSQVDVTGVAISYNGGTSGLITIANDDDGDGIVEASDSDGVANVTVGGRAFTVTFNDDGTVDVGNVEGTSNGSRTTDIAVFTATGYNELQFSYVSGTPFLIGNFGVAVQSTDPVDFTVPISVIDNDGDIVSSGNLAIHATAPASASLALQNSSTEETSLETSSLFASNDNIDQQQRAFNIGQNTALMGALAAAGLSAEPLAASTLDGSAGDSEPDYIVTTMDDGTDAGGNTGGRGPRGESKLQSDGEKQAADGPQDSRHSRDDSGSNDNDDSGAEAQTQEPAALLQGTDAPAQGNAEATAITVDSVAMPSAEQLSATDGQSSGVEGDGNAQDNAVVGKILADALNGGGDGPDLEALVSAFAGRGGHKDGATDRGPEGLASHGNDAVSNGDMGVLAAFHGAHGTDMIDLTMHQDAAPLNG